MTLETKFTIMTFVFSVICLVLGMVIQYYFGHSKCDHTWEKVYDGTGEYSFQRRIIYMCKKCGKTKIIRNR